MRTVVDAIVERAGGSGTLTLLGDGTEVVDVTPWRAVHERARRMSAVLTARGLGPGCRVGLLGDTGTDLVAALQAVWLTGGAVNLIPPTGRGTGRGDQSGHAEHVLAVTGDARLDLAVVDEAVPAAVTSVLSAATTVLPLAELAGRAQRRAPATPYRPAPADLALLQYTSGSTRNPRGVPVTHGHLAANVDAIKRALDHEATHPSRMLSWLPLYHDMGLIAFLVMPMSCGCPLILQSPNAFARRPGSWLEAMSRHRVTMSGAPNFGYALMTRLLSAGVPTELDLTSVTCLVSGGEPVDAAMMARFAAAAQRYGLAPDALLPAYGLAEATLAATISRRRAGLLVDTVDPQALERYGRAEPRAGGRQLVRVGRPVYGTSVRVVDRRTGVPVGDRVVGHVEVRGSAVVGHYWGDPPPKPGSWLRTGDLGYLVDGELVVCGREKDVLFAAGRNVYPQDVEAVAAEVSGVRPGGAVAFGVPGEHGDRLVLVVESRDAGADADAQAAVRAGVGDAVRAVVGLNPADVVVVRSGRLPKTSSGKLRRAEARRRYLARELTEISELGAR